jgi:hypothetical protein
MSSLIFNSALDDEARGNINFASDTFYCLLTTSSYTPNKDTHTKRSDVTNEVAATGGYVAGGFVVTVTVTKDTANDRIDISLGGFSVGSATITARRAVYYKHRGGASSADELVVVNEFANDVTSTNGTWMLQESTLRLQN